MGNALGLGQGMPGYGQPGPLTGWGNPVQSHPNIAPYQGAAPQGGWNPGMVQPGTTQFADPNQLAQPNALYQGLGYGAQPGQTIGQRQMLWDQNRAASGMYPGQGPYWQSPAAPMASPPTDLGGVLATGGGGWNPAQASQGIQNAFNSVPGGSAGVGVPLTGRGNPVQVHPNIAPYQGAPPTGGWNPGMLGPGTTAHANPGQLAQPNALFQGIGVGPQPGQTIGDRQSLWDANRAASGLYGGR